jgi:hypothetical protein
MKRAMGLVLAALAFAMVTHADRIEYGGRAYAAGAGAELRAQTPSTLALDGSNPLIDAGSIASRAGWPFGEPGDAERLTDLVFYSHFGDSEEAVVRPVEFDSIRQRLASIWGDRYDRLREYLRIEHSDPFRPTLGVEEVPEPGTLLLIGTGLAALAVWKRRTITSA